MQHDARLLRLHRVYRLTVGETLRKSHHALRQPDLPQLLILLLSQLLVALSVAIAELRARLRCPRVVEDNLLVECLVARSKRGIVHSEERQLRRNDFGYRGGRHTSAMRSSLGLDGGCLGTYQKCKIAATSHTD